MELSNPLGIKYRVVEEITHLGEPARMVSGSATFETTLEDLWNAVSSPERISNWLLPISGELKLGAHYQLEGHASGKISRCEEPNAFDATWEYGDNVSWIRVRLDKQQNGARLTLEHIMSKDAASEDHWRKYGPGATGVGWDLSFLGLHQHITSKAPVPQSELNSWLSSDDGKNFIRECSTGWADAHTESGEEESIARNMAEATRKFYCGE